MIPHIEEILGATNDKVQFFSTMTNTFFLQTLR